MVEAAGCIVRAWTISVIVTDGRILSIVKLFSPSIAQRYQRADFT